MSIPYLTSIHMNAKRLRELILYIISQVDEMGGYVTTIRLVKFLYLIDLEFYRRYGKTLTSLNWTYYIYGPYVMELPSIIQNVGYDLAIEEFETTEGHYGRSFQASYFQETPDWLSGSGEEIILGLLNIWADQDTKNLLKYVYNTEPLRLGTKNQPIDFTLASRGSRYVNIYIPQISMEIKNKIKESVSKYATLSTREYLEIPKTDSIILQEGLAELESSENEFADFTGLVEVSNPGALQTYLFSDE